MASNRPLPGDIKVTGMDQASLFAWMANVTDLLNELKADHASMRTAYDAHTHKLPATPVEDENTSAPDTTAATGAKAPGTASAFPAALSNSTDITLNRS